jgi:hypothetical protein
MRKRELRTGMRVTNRCGQVGIIFIQYLKFCNGLIYFGTDGLIEPLKNYNDDLQMIKDGFSDFDIIKVEVPNCWHTEWEIN